MGAIGAFPTVRNVLVEGDNIINFVSEGTILAGQVVAFNTTGVSFSLLPSIKATTGQCVGVALNDATTGVKVRVAMDGCIVNVVNTDDSATIDAGDVLEGSTNAVGGCVAAVDLMDAGVLLVMKYQVGIALDDNVGTTAGTTSRMLVSCGRFCSANNA